MSSLYAFVLGLSIPNDFGMVKVLLVVNHHIALVPLTVFLPLVVDFKWLLVDSSRGNHECLPDPMEIGVKTFNTFKTTKDNLVVVSVENLRAAPNS